MAKKKLEVSLKHIPGTSEYNVVLEDGTIIGYIDKRGNKGEEYWVWMLTVPRDDAVQTSGVTETRKDALAGVETAVNS